MNERAAVQDIQANAQLVLDVARRQLDQAVSFDAAGVRWLDGYVQRQHEQGDPSKRHGLMNTLGSFLGECILRSYGGAWAQVDGSWCIEFEPGNAAFPFAKVAKQLAYGSQDSVESFFTAIPLLFKRGPGSP